MRLVLDLDTGIDDALAIAYAATRKDIDLIGCTTVFGNVQTEMATRNTLAVLHLLGRDDVPVYQGLSSPWGTKRYAIKPSSLRFHGENGLGNVHIPDSPRKAEKKSADQFLTEAVENQGEKLTIVTTGPLTNLASFVLNHPPLRSGIHHLVMMGGSLCYGGNATPWAEANILHDAKAAKYLLESGIPMMMVGLDVTETITLRGSDADAWEEKGKPFADMLRFYLAQHEDQSSCFVHDPTAVVAALHPKWMKTVTLPLTVLQEGTEKGMVLATRQGEASVSVAVQADKEQVEMDLRNTYRDAFSR